MGQKMVTPPVAFLGANYWMVFGEEYYHKSCLIERLVRLTSCPRSEIEKAIENPDLASLNWELFEEVGLVQNEIPAESYCAECEERMEEN